MTAADWARVLVSGQADMPLDVILYLLTRPVVDQGARMEDVVIAYLRREGRTGRLGRT